MAVLVATDFFTVEVLTVRGLITYYVLFFIHLESRRICLAGITHHPDQSVRPKCQCRDAIISFHPLPTRNEAGTKPLTKLPETSCISVSYHYDSGDIEILPDSRHGEATGRELIVALRQQQPDVGGFLAKRHGVLRQLYRYSMKRTTVRLPTPKPGRNDPCPCGSGKKFKKCCGA